MRTFISIVFAAFISLLGSTHAFAQDAKGGCGGSVTTKDDWSAKCGDSVTQAIEGRIVGDPNAIDEAFLYGGRQLATRWFEQRVTMCDLRSRREYVVSIARFQSAFVTVEFNGDEWIRLRERTKGFLAGAACTR